MAPLAQAVLALVFNYATSMGLVFANKALFSHTRFPASTLTALHLLFTAGALRCGWALHLAPAPAAKLGWQMTTLLGALQAGAILFSNASLAINPARTYQLSKHLQLPAVLLLQYLLAGEIPGGWRLLWLAGALAGVFVATGPDLDPQTHAAGAACAGAAVACCAIEIVLWGRLQKRDGHSALRLLSAQAPTAAAVCTVAALAAEGVESFAALRSRQPGELLLLTVSCGAALLVNWSTVLATGLASPVAYAVLGLFKTASVFVGGALLFDGKPSPWATGGASVALCCMLGYSVLTIRERAAAAAQPRPRQGSLGPVTSANSTPQAPARAPACLSESTQGVSDDDTPTAGGEVVG
eukprot:TRINITY_DN13602_c0_g1_i1.p1 TRINITY_DN13602_c0_g1~~TRINITY_DN13602_c0_g1_i1.p1  ORF type:complete len:354 (+),score=110.72 TRINITY_DN13602_c0_g1_i1:76-1137(+)